MSKRTMKNEIEQFISLFHKDDKFLTGLCYWFAYILKGRFPNGEIWYDQVENHFYFKFDNVAYDVRGQVTLPNTSIRWDEYKKYDPLDYKRVVKYCVLKHK